jgi:transposase
MHVRVSRVRRNGKRYEYAQLVESYRRDDGMPAHRVVANLGSLTPDQVDNLKAALSASRRGERVAVAAQPSRAPKPQATLRYLDLAVLLELWRQWKLDELLEQLLGTRSAAAVVCALTLHRCVDPQSKLHAVRWLPRTALPELLDLPAGRFNNTRLHRVLELLDRHGYALMKSLPVRVAERQPQFVALYGDVTDTWFVGNGPELAERGKTKEGLYERKIGIVLLCSNEGMPLRWDVIPGNDPDDRALTRMLASVRGLGWVGDTPVVCDRAVGKTATLRDLVNTGLRFLTALNSTEISKYASTLPWEALQELSATSEEQLEQVAHTAAERIVEGGMTAVDETLYVLDLGIVDCATRETTRAADAPATVQHALELAKQMDEGVHSGRFTSQAAAAHAVGLGESNAKKHRTLLRLPESIQAAVLRGEANGCSLKALVELADTKDPQQQQDAFGQLVASAHHDVQPRKAATRSTPSKPAPKLRCVGYFNPDVFARQRLQAHRKLVHLRALVDELNERAKRPRSHLTPEALRRSIEQKLLRQDLLTAFSIDIDKDPATGKPQVRMELNADDWSRRRRYDGFTVLVGHPELPHSTETLCKLYRAKNAVEVDFHVIKSAVKVRPVRHHTDPKVRAHVTLCMLALLLHRTLAQRLRTTTPEAALETLSTCAMHRWGTPGRTSRALYSLTHADADQSALLRELRMLDLVDDAQLRTRLEPGLHLQG